MRPVNIEFENESGGRRYPFSQDSAMVDMAGNELPCDLFTDAVLYPDEGKCVLSSISSENGVCTVVVLAGSSELSGRFSAGDRRVELYCDGLHRGTLVLGRSADSFASDPTVHQYAGAEFSMSCQFPIGDNGVNAAVFGDAALRGDVSIVPGAGKASIVPVVSDNGDGTSDLRFDVVHGSGLQASDRTGVRSIYILRKPGSYFNVLDRGGRPYLFLTRNGRMYSSALIGRSTICRALGNSVTSEGKDRSYQDDCGTGRSSSSSSSIGGDCFATDSFLDSNDPEITVTNGVRSYGYIDIPRKYGFHGGTSMALMFLEERLYASFACVGPYVAMIVDAARSYHASRLFYDGKTSDTWFVRIRLDSYEAVWDYYSSLHPGEIGIVTKEGMEAGCRERGWLYEDGDDQGDADERTVREAIVAGGYSKTRYMYTVRARDMFEGFGCKNWEVSSEEHFGNEVRHLVGWGDIGDSFFGQDSGNRYVQFGRDVKIPAWIVARYSWWREWSKNGDWVRHFIVPKERGLVIYTGDYYQDGDPSKPREVSPTSWTCPFGRPEISSTAYQSSSRAMNDGDMGANAVFFMNCDLSGVDCLNVLKDRLHREYPHGYDPTFGDTVFSSIGLPDDVMASYAEADTSNMVDENTTVVQPYPEEYLPISTDDRYVDEKRAGYWLGPLEYRYGETYIPGQGYPGGGPSGDDDDAIVAPIAFRFDITRASANAFNFDVTDMVAAGMSYDNPIHVTVVTGEQVPRTMDVDDPTDPDQLEEGVRRITTRSTAGNGIEISIPGLGVS